MPNPYPATFEVAENLHVRLDGDVTFTDPANQPGGGGGGQVNSVTAGDASITIAGTVTDPTVAVAALGVTSGKIASNAVTQAKLAAKAVGAAQMDSGAASANWVPVADGTGGVVYAASPGVNSLTAADTSVVVGGTASSPTVRTGTLDTIATQHPPTAAVAVNSQKITGLANGTLASDAAAFGQIPTALPPNGSAGGDLTGTFPNPTVAAIEGVAVSGTAPTANQVLTASDATHAAWADPTAAGVSSLDTITGAVTLVAGSNITITDNSPSAGDITIAASGGGSSPLTTKGDIFGHSTVDARIPVGTNGYVLLADSAQTLGVGYSTRDVALNTHKITGLTEGAASGEAATYSATPAGIVTAKGDLVVASGSHAATRLAVGSNTQVLTSASGATNGVDWEYPPSHELDYVQRTTDLTASTETDYIVGNAVTYDGSTRVKIELGVSGVSCSNTGGVIFELYDGTTVLCRLADARGVVSTLIPVYGAIFLTPSAASHTYKVTAQLAGTGSPVVHAGTGSGGASTYPPAFLRITTA